MIRTVLIDDEKSPRKLLRHLLQKYFVDFIEIIGEADDVVSGTELIDNEQPDLILLDIQLSDGSGFDLLDRIKEQRAEVIFVTAYHEHAMKAFDYGAFDYLLKPFTTEKFKTRISRAIKHIEVKVSSVGARYEVLREAYQKEKQLKRIVVSNSAGFDIIDFDQIIRLESTNVYTNFYLEDGVEIVSSKSIKFYDELLTNFDFLRVHQSHIVNLKKVKRYIRGNAGELELSDGSNVPISRAKKKHLMESFDLG